ncbi:MAG: hypothetical protein A2W80_09555 [Candidatus Riflebacteria bacterium GWC2_50_8]|nr:MAG: hypothetical protein A2W80_09555 [Candidatus Riflebacteria bacterium GWC2_50_8]
MKKSLTLLAILTFVTGLACGAPDHQQTNIAKVYELVLEDYKALYPLGDDRQRNGLLSFEKTFMPKYCELPEIPQAVREKAAKLSFKNIGDPTVLEGLAGIVDASCDKYIDQAYANFLVQLKKDVKIPEEPEKIDFVHSIPSGKCSKEMIVLTLLALYHLNGGNQQAGIRAMLACAGMAPALTDGDFSKFDAGVSIRSQNCFANASKILLLCSENLSPSLKTLKKLAAVFARLRAQIPPLSFEIKLLRNFFQNFYATYEHQASKIEGSEYSYALPILKEVSKRMEIKANELCTPAIGYCDKPWSAGTFSRLQEIDAELDKLVIKSKSRMEKQDSVTEASLDWYELLADEFVVIGFHNVPNLYRRHVRVNQIIDGCLVAFAVKSYEKETGGLPENLDALQNWAGNDISVKDGFTGKNLVYSQSPMRLFSCGPDMKPDTSDDIIFCPSEEENLSSY